MIVLDADSVIDGDTMVRLAALMEANPRTGLIQTPYRAGRPRDAVRPRPAVLRRA